MSHIHREVAQFPSSSPSSSIAASPGLHRRAFAVLRHGELDRRLADGEAVDDDGWLSVRAWQVTRPGERDRLASVLEEILVTAGSGRRNGVRDDVGAARTEMVRAVRRLRDGQPVRPRGMAVLRDLLSDGAGPLYSPHSRDELREQVHRAVDELG